MPTDFSASANNALTIAVALCKKHNAVLHLLHVKESRYIIATPGTDVSLPSLAQEIDTDARENLYNAYESVMRTGIGVQIHMPTGIPYDEICKSADAMPIDLIVMGMHGISGPREFFTGTTAYNVIKNSTRPVLTIPDHFNKECFGNVLFPVRTIPGVKEKFDYLLPLLLRNAGAQLHIAVVQHTAEESCIDTVTLNDIFTSLEQNSITSSYSINKCNNIAEQVLHLAKTYRADLIAINATLDYKNTQFFIGPYTQQIISHAHVPVLSFRQAIDVATEIRKNEDKKLVRSISGL